ncbi:hypothetical protein LSAT2_019586 [Lamellibrachia satsuma]|nr:hypothetical protein LSAT2_019586 [Lamellibrachia satsuma]
MDIVSGTQRKASALKADQMRLKKSLRQAKDGSKGTRQTLHERMSRETTDLNRRIQSMQSELKKKDLDMQRSESHMSRIEDDHRHQLEKMRAALNEKDRTIEALVGSGREKDKLFHQVHGSASPDVGSIGSSVDKMAALQELRDEVAQLKNQLLNKDDLIEQLYTKADQRDFDTVPRVELDMSEKEIASKTEALMRSLRRETDARRTVRNLKKQLKELSNGHLGSDLLLDHERVTTDCLEGQLDRPGCPERTQTTIGSDSSAQVAEDSLLETQKLKAVLEAEADIYESIRKVAEADPTLGVSRAYTLVKVAEADPTLGTTAEKLETELKQVQSLRQQLAGDITHNQELRAQLSKHVGDKSDGDKSGVANETTAEQLESLRTQLEESQRWNSSLQARLSQQQPTTHTRGGGVGATTTDMTSDMTSTTNDHAMARSLPESSALPSATSLLSYQPDHSAHMGPTSTDDIYEQITQLKLDLGQSRSQNKELRNQLNLVMNRRTDCDDDILGQNVTDASVAGAVALSRKPAFIDLVSNTGNTRDHMMSSSQHDTVPDGPSISTTSCGHDTEPSLIKMSDSGANTSKLVLGTQTDSLNSSKIAPELVTEMAQEIDRLTEDLELARSRMHELETIQKNGFPEGVPTTAGFPQAKGIAAETGFPQGVSTAAGFQQRVPTKAEFPQGVPTTAGFLQGDSTVTGFSTTAGFLQGNFTATGVSTTAGFPQGIPTTAGFSQGVPTTAGFPQGVPTTAGFPQQDPTTAEFPLGFPTTIGYPQGVPTTAGFSQGDSIATGVLTTSVFPQEVPTTAGFPLEVPTTAGFPQGVPTTAGFPQGVPTTAEFPQAVPTTAGFPQGVSTVAGFPQGVFTAAGCSQGIPTTAGFPQGDSTAPGFLGGVSTVVGFPQGVSTMMTANSSYNGPNQPVTSLTASQKGQDRSHSNSIDASLAVLQNTLQVHQPAQKETVAPSVVHRCVQTVEVSETAVQRALQTQTEALKKELEDVKDKLASTEATVRSQTRKMKYYRGMLHDAGLMPSTPIRSHSDSSLMSPGLSLPLSVNRSCSHCSVDLDSVPPSTSLTRLQQSGQLEDEGGILATSPSLLIARSSSSDALQCTSDMDMIGVNGALMLVDKLPIDVQPHQSIDDTMPKSPLGGASKSDVLVRNLVETLEKTFVSECSIDLGSDNPPAVNHAQAVAPQPRSGEELDEAPEVELTRLRSELTAMTRELESLTYHDQKLEGKVEEMLRLKEEWKRQEQQLRWHNQELSCEVELFKIRLDELKGSGLEVESYEQELTGHIAELEAYKQEMNGFVTELKCEEGKLKGHVQVLKDNLEETQGKLDEVKMQKEEMEKQVGQMKTEEHELRGQLEEMMIQDERVKSQKSSEVEQLKRHEEELRGRLEQMKADAQQLQDDEEEMERRVGCLKHYEVELQEIQDQCGEVQQEVDQLKCQDAQLRNEICQLKCQEEEIGNHIEEVRGHEEALRNKEKLLEDRVESLKVDVNNREDQLLLMTDEESKLQGQVELLRDDEIKLQDQIELLRDEEGKLRKEVVSLKEQEQVLSQMEVVKDQEDSLKGSVQLLTGQEDSLKGSVQLLTGQEDSLKGSVQLLTGQEDSLKASVQLLTGQEDSVKASVQLLTGQEDSLKASVQLLTGQEEDLNHQLELLKDQKVELQNQMELLGSEKEELKVRVGSLRVGKKR